MTIRRTRRARSDAGFTLLELLIATSIMVVVTGAIFSLMHPAQGLFESQPEVSDMQQRLRVGVDSLQKDIVMAGAGTYTGAAAGTLSYFMAPLMPYRAFGNDTDTSAGIYYRNDRISMMYVPPTPSQTTIAAPMPVASTEVKAEPQPQCPRGEKLCGFTEGDRLIVFDESGNWDLFTVTEVQDDSAHLQHRLDEFSVRYEVGAYMTAINAMSYYLKNDAAAGTNQLIHVDGDGSESAVVDNVVKLEFQYFGDPEPPRLTGKPLTSQPGPWTTYGPVPPPLGTVRGSWPAGENCTIAVVGGNHVPRLPVIGAGGLGMVELTEAMLTDGPWCPDNIRINRFDADVLRIRRVRVSIRVQAALAALRGPAGPLFTNGGTAEGGAKYVPDQEIHFDVTPRNMNLGR